MGFCYPDSNSDPVSYTHLDVYKRQGLHHRPGPWKGHMIPGEVMGTPNEDDPGFSLYSRTLPGRRTPLCGGTDPPCTPILCRPRVPVAPGRSPHPGSPLRYRHARTTREDVYKRQIYIIAGKNFVVAKNPPPE